MKRVIIVHGWGGHPEKNWFPWLRENLEEKGYQVLTPQMPNPEAPIVLDWLSTLRENISAPNQETFLIGHSLGVITILRYLERLKAGEKIGGAILVAGFSQSLGIPEIEEFTYDKVQFDTIKEHSQKFVVISSDNDPYVPISQGELLRDQLGADFISMHNAGHLNVSHGGFYELPIVLEKILEISVA